jgi:transposase-like protein
MIARSKVGHSALNLQAQLGISSYETAWSMVHKLRRAMINPQRDLLAIVPKPPEPPWPDEDRWEVEVEVDERLVGDKEKGVSGRETRTKSLVVVAVEVRGAADPISGFRDMGRVRLARLLAADEPNLIDFIEDVVAPGAIVNTDGWSGYHNLETASLFGYRHVVHNLSAKARENPDDPKMPNVHRIIGNLKRVLIGTHWGSVRPKQLDYYLDEFTFRWNRHGAKSRGLLFFRLIELAAQTPAVTREQIVVSMRPQDAVQISNLLYDSDLRHWFLGGWGVDALLGKQSRIHGDLDLLVPKSDVADVERLLRSRQWISLADWEARRRKRVVDGATGELVRPKPREAEQTHVVSLVDKFGRRVDLHPLDIRSKVAVETLADGQRYEYPEPWLEGIGQILGQTVNCLTAEAQLARHSGYAGRIADEHRRDIALLCRHLGLKPPPGYRQLVQERKAATDDREETDEDS